MVEVGTA